MDWHNLAPLEIEKLSFETISSELGGGKIPKDCEAIVKRVIHTTADFDYVENLYFSSQVVKAGKEALLSGAHIEADTHMAKAGINKSALQKLGGKVHCFMSDDDVALSAKKEG